MRIANLIAIARAEMRLTRRLVRYWVFLALSYLVGVAGYFYYGALHAFFSSFSATVASIGPRYLIGAMGLYYLVIFLVGIVFLGFDLRARDTRERMVEVLDSRPFTNLELVAGRFVGLLLPAWVPVVLLVVLLQALGYLLPALGSPVGGTMEPVSLLAFSLFMALPAVAFALALVFLMTLLVRNRLIAAVTVLAVLGGLFWATLRLPLAYGSFFDIIGAYMVNFPSEIVPGVADGVGWLQRPAVLLAALGLLVLAAAVHPRLDGGSRSQGAVTGGALLLLALALMGLGTAWRLSDLEQLETWREAHAARADEAVPDVVSVGGEVRIEPGRGLALEVKLGLRARGDEVLPTALLTLNPGLTVGSVRDEAGVELPFTHGNGLLEIELAEPLTGDSVHSLFVNAAGVLDLRFGYLDAAKVPEAGMAWEGQIFLLGYERAIDRRGYVALMPGVRWLPAAGADVGRDDPRARERDFFDVDLTVEVPGGWLAGGPGRRQVLEAEGERTRYRFAPGAPVPEAAIIASRFVSYSAEIAGVLLEVLVDPGHTRVFEDLADAETEVRTWVAERLDEAAESGLAYPYDGLTVVEVPTTLRGFKGGWRLDTALAPPAMVLMRESGLPTARFDVPFRRPERWRDREGGLPRAKRDRLKAFCINDFSGGNLFTGVARSFVPHLTSARGPEAIAVNFVLEELTALYLTDTRGYFSAHMFSPELNQAVGRALQSYFTSGRRDANVAAAVIDAFTARPEVWNAVLGVSLRDLEPAEEPQRTVDVLTLKGGALAQSIYDELGADKVGEILAALRDGYRGRTFDLAAVTAASAAVDEDLEQLLEDWLVTTDLPGFVADEAEAYRLPDGDDGGARYQLVMTVRNDEPVPGLFKVAYLVGEGSDREREESDPIRLGGTSSVRYATVLSRAPVGVWVEPYLALNRDPFRVPLPEVDDEEIVRAEALEGVETVAWQRGDDRSIVVDDLDESFRTEGAGERSGVRLGARATDAEVDTGLPLQEFGRPPATWARATSGSAWGRYRHTVAYVRPGSGSQRALFTAAIPSTGSWNLEVHLPHPRRFRRARTWGVWTLEVEDASGRREVSFDATAAGQGWTFADSLELAAGEVTVALANRTEGQVVVADAIRWTPAAGNGGDAGEANEISETSR